MKRVTIIALITSLFVSAIAVANEVNVLINSWGIFTFAIVGPKGLEIFFLVYVLFRSMLFSFYVFCNFMNWSLFSVRTRKSIININITKWSKFFCKIIVIFTFFFKESKPSTLAWMYCSSDWIPPVHSVTSLPVLSKWWNFKVTVPDDWHKTFTIWVKRLMLPHHP